VTGELYILQKQTRQTKNGRLVREGKYKMVKINLFKIFTISIFFTILGNSIVLAENIIYVDDDAIGANDGSSWENAFNYLQDALAVASDGDEIHVAQGVYTPDSNSAIPDGTGDQEAAFQLMNDISLRGGYAGFGQIDPDTRDIELYRTILSGDLNGDDVDVNAPADLNTEPTRVENSYHVVICSSNAVLDGLIITGGNANGPRLGTNLHRNGGGIYNPEGQLSLVNCTIERNIATSNGGGIFDSDSDLSMLDCTFTGNVAGDNGGGIYDPGGKLSLSNCTFTENYTGSNGGGIYTGSEPTIDNCTFIKNSASIKGGGVFNSESGTDRIIFGNLASSNYTRTPNYPSEPGINNCTFIENTARYGGGMCNDGSSPIMTNCTFIRNATNSKGGGMYNYNDSSPTLNGCAFIGNSGHDSGGGIYIDGSSIILINCMLNGNRVSQSGGALYIYRGQVYLINCTLIWNSAETGASMTCQSFSLTQCSAEVINCILWDGSNAIWEEGSPTINVSFSNIRGGWEGDGNIDEDPLFVDQLGPDHVPGTEDDDLRLVPVSPCVDAADPDYVTSPNETDLDGNPRIVTRRVDMGAYEFQGNVYVDDDAPYEQWTGEPEIYHLEEDGSEPRPFDTIQEAIDIAKDGYTVLVRPGLYGKIDFKGKAITVAGTEGAAVIESYTVTRGGHNREDAVTFHTGEGPRSILKNFIIRESATAISLNFSSPTLYNLTIVENLFGIAGYENSHPDIRNCILWDNTNGDLFQCEAKYSCIENGIGGEGNINVNPLFVDADNGDYHLKSEGWRWNSAGQSWTWDDVTSSCIDAGDPCSPLGEEPMRVPRDPNNLYGINQYINMGAYGGTCQASMPPLNWPPVGEDNTPPIPDPAQWAPDGAPREVQIGTGNIDYWIEMKAQPASDASGFVEYFFECTTESGFSSGWQSSNEYKVQVGRSGQGLRFRVKARDIYGNETAWSEERTVH
jgi:predicted outer membrane repeat protein